MICGHERKFLRFAGIFRLITSHEHKMICARGKIWTVRTVTRTNVNVNEEKIICV